MKAEGRYLEKIQYAVLVLLFYLTTFEEPLEYSAMPFLYGIFNICALFAVPLIIGTVVFDALQAVRTSRASSVRQAVKPYALPAFCVVIFVICGLIGYAHFHYQSLSNTWNSIFDTMRFWLLLCFFYVLFRGFDLKSYVKPIFTHAAVISGFMTAAVVADMIFHIWPRQVRRFGIGSIQIFYSHPTNLAVHCVFLLCILCLLAAWEKKALYFMPALLFDLFMTLRLRILGLILVILLMFVFFVLLDQKLTWLNGTAMGVGAFLIGGKRFIRYYTSEEALTMARGQFAYNGWRIGVANLPFGTGAGTFGSRVAQRYYSPLYHKYGMTNTVGMDPIWPAYACDTFWPMILAEYGFIGLACYITMVLLLFVRIQKLRTCGVWIYMAGMTGFAYEILETTGALAFSDVTAVSLALLFGLVFAMKKEPAEDEPLRGMLREQIRRRPSE